MQYFPNEIIRNIFLNLTLKEILQCNQVCKSWKSFIQNDSFISEYFSLKFFNFPRIKGTTLSNSLKELSLALFHAFNAVKQDKIPLAIYEASSTASIAYHRLLSISDKQKHWLSEGTPTPRESYLIFGLGVYDIGIVESISIRFMNYFDVIFSSESAEITIFDGDRIIYSLIVLLSHTEKKQTIYFTNPVFITKSNRIKITFIGQRARRQGVSYIGQESLYYTSANVVVLGISGEKIPFRLENNSFYHLTIEEINNKNKIHGRCKNELQKIMNDFNQSYHLIENMQDEEAKIFDEELSNFAVWNDHLYNNQVLTIVEEQMDDSDSE